MKQTILCTLLCSLFCLAAKGVTIPRDHVFIFERSTNSNYVCYDVNLEKGQLSQKEPLKAYWVLGGETRIENLTFLERKVAFGVKVVSTKENEAVVHLTAYKALHIRVCKREGTWVGIVNLNGHDIVLQKMFAQMKPPINAKCEYVEIFGTDLKTGEKRKERITQ